jgi:hypothetical protein
MSCPAGFTTTVSIRPAIRADNCSVCAAGFGGTSCTACLASTFSPGGTIDPCIECNCTAEPCQLAVCDSRDGSCTSKPDPSQVDSNCGTPGFPMKCTSTGVCANLCLPFNCSGQYAGRCGVNLPDGCGGRMNCSCPKPSETCDARFLGVDGACSRTCVPRLCPFAFPPAILNSSAYCGSDLDDGCGGTMNCPCTGRREVCSTAAANVTGYCQCPNPMTCDSDYRGLCGSPLESGCLGKFINCSCPLPGASCPHWGSGRPGPCSCEHRNCSSLPLRTCGEALDDGCGSTFNCPCPLDTFCSTAGRKNVIGNCSTEPCRPLTCADYPTWCGRLPDGCGGNITCTCSGPSEVCSVAEDSGVRGRCLPPTGCPPLTCADYSRNLTCGTSLPDGCGGQLPGCMCEGIRMFCTAIRPGMAGLCRALPPLPGR